MENVEEDKAEPESGIEASLAIRITKETERRKRDKIVVDLGNGSQVVYIPRFFSSSSFDDQLSSKWPWQSSTLTYLDTHIPWTRPTIRVFGRSCLQPRDTCYVASPGLQELRYSGYQPRAYSWDEFPPLKHILDAVHKAFPGTYFNSLLLNRYKTGNDYVGWHADDEKLYGPTPEIASVSFGCDREFLLKKKKRPTKVSPQVKGVEGAPPPSKKIKKTNDDSSDHHSFMLKHGSLLLMRGYTQQDWLHSVPKRAKADAMRINLTFRRVI